MRVASDIATKLVRFSVIILFGAYTVILYLNDQLQLYIHPRLLVFTVGMSVLAMIVGLCGLGTTLHAWVKSRRAGLISDIRNSFLSLLRDPKASLMIGILLFSLVVNMAALLFGIVLLIPFKRSKVDGWLRRVSWLQVLVALAIFCAYVFPPRTLSPLAAAQSGSGLNSLVSNTSANALSLFNFDYEKYSIGDWLKTINLNPDLQSYENKPVSVIGFVFRPESLAADQFLVSRFVISCCAVDARPIGLNVLAADLIKGFQPGDWVQVKGTFKVANISGEDTLQIIPTEITSATQPRNPYIY